MSELSHKHIIYFIEMYQDINSKYIVMEYADNSDLMKLITE